MKKKTPTPTPNVADDIGECFENICDVIHDGAQVGLDLLDCLCRAKMPLLCSPLQLPKLFALCRLPLLPLPLPFPFPPLGTCQTPAKTCGCDIPPPCWAPKPLCDVHTAVTPGETAKVDIHVENCGAETRTITFQAIEPGVTIAPASMSLGPMERGQAAVSMTTADAAAIGSEREFLVWVRGCHDHYFRWTVTVSKHSSGPDEVHVEDCPDYVHHWYDHFYCERPCVHKT